MKKDSFIRSDVKGLRVCPFGLPITKACLNAGNSVSHMCPLKSVPEEKQDEVKKANSRVYVYYKTGDRCMYAANVMKNQDVVNCDFGDTGAGMHTPAFSGSPLYAQNFSGYGLGSLYAYPMGYYADNMSARNLFFGLFSLVSGIEYDLIKEGLDKKLLEKLENESKLTIGERLDLENVIEKYGFKFENTLINKLCLKYSQSHIGLEEKLNLLKNQFVIGAQKSYDEWQQDDEGYDEMLGHGGICQEIADEICDVCNRNDIDCITQDAQVGEQHVWAVAYDDNKKEAFEIDISPYVYESGSGYNWKKIPNVKFDVNDIHISEVDYDHLNFE